MVMDSSGDEYEPFQVTEEDQLAERFPQRRRRRQTREDRIYGMWAQHDSDDEDRRWAEREGGSVRGGKAVGGVTDIISTAFYVAIEQLF